MEEFHEIIETCGIRIRNIVVFSVVALLTAYLIFLFILVLSGQELRPEQASLVGVLIFAVIIALGFSFKGVLSALGTLRERLASDENHENSGAIFKIETSKLQFLVKALEWLSPIYLLIFFSIFLVFGIFNQETQFHASTVSLMAFLGLLVVILPGLLLSQTGGKLIANSGDPETNRQKWLIVTTVVVALAGGGGVFGLLTADESSDNLEELEFQVKANGENIEKILYQLEQLNLRNSINSN